MLQEQTVVTVTMNPAVDLACTVPGFALGEVNRVARARTDPGGKGINIARLLRLFNLPVAGTGFLGADNAGLFERLFQQRGIQDAFVRLPGETRTDVKVVDPEAKTTTDINCPGLTPDTPHLAALFSTVDRLSRDAGLVVIAGSLPPGLEDGVVAKLVAMARARGLRAVVDTSGPALAEAIAAKPSLIKPNTLELGQYLGRSVESLEDVVAEARALVRGGIETVAVSLGERGAVFVEAEAAVVARPPQIEAVSTVGAGDAMVAGLCAGLARGLPLPERARLATAMAAAVVAQPGPCLSDIGPARALESLVVVEPLEARRMES
ncbi:1-phosphofructokinase [Solidesulfovibrio fructosivorans JJ]]|uniref:1-phosphofructokinase n=1 Tax=Solidesulfovibrio fructosivorans JJ] TaxID=596151 RepID=E1JSY8_SOLFR|nr:1-phosphofructokinase [Solidesulfovibrio fructosivorans]EFL52621.1 1-phosphofructokinase [Solidesulfovibrio fructosivorans JJ]]